MKVTQEQLKALVIYDPETGSFRRKVALSRSPVGRVLGSLTPNGYVYISVGGMKYGAHRLAWVYMTGKVPHLDIDHIDGDRENNRWGNLRHVDRSTNLENMRTAKSHNKSTGLLGAYKCGNIFTSRIQVNGKDKYLGTFETARLAHAAYIGAKRQLHKGGML